MIDISEGAGFEDAPGGEGPAEFGPDPGGSPDGDPSLGAVEGGEVVVVSGPGPAEFGPDPGGSPGGDPALGTGGEVVVTGPGPAEFGPDPGGSPGGDPALGGTAVTGTGTGI